MHNYIPLSTDEAIFEDGQPFTSQLQVSFEEICSDLVPLRIHLPRGSRPMAAC